MPTPTAGKPPLKVSFKTDLALPAAPTTWTLVYGDGNTRDGTGVPPHFMGHTYESAGTFQVLFVLNAAGGRTYASTVAINPPSGGGGGGGGGGPTTTTTTTTTPAAPRVTATKTGTVLVNGVPFTGGPIAYNTPVDVSNGRLTITTDTGKVTVYGSGIHATFTLSRGTDQGHAVVVFTLTNGDFSSCKRKKASATFATARVIRQLWGNGEGHFRTKGRYAAATVRGTFWLTADRCDGTLVKVNRGIVQVTSKRKPVLVRAGHSYLAKP